MTLESDWIIKRFDFWKSFTEIVVAGIKIKLLAGREEGMLPVGFTSEHLEVIKEAGRPVSQAGALCVSSYTQGSPLHLAT